MFKDSPNKKFAESKLQKLYKKKTKKDPLPVLHSLERLLNENKIIKISKDRYCLKLGENFSEGIVVKTSKSSVFVSDSTGEDIKIKNKSALFALAGDKVSLNQINISKGKKSMLLKRSNIELKTLLLERLIILPKLPFLLALKKTYTLTY